MKSATPFLIYWGESSHGNKSIARQVFNGVLIHDIVLRNYILPHSMLHLQISIALVCLDITIRQSYTMMQAAGQAVKGKLMGFRS